MTTASILIAIQFEERDLVATYGQKYRRYEKEVSMIIPGVRPYTNAIDRPAAKRATA